MVDSQYFEEVEELNCGGVYGMGIQNERSGHGNGVARAHRKVRAPEGFTPDAPGPKKKTASGSTSPALASGHSKQPSSAGGKPPVSKRPKGPAAKAPKTPNLPAPEAERRPPKKRHHGSQEEIEDKAKRC